MADSRKRKGTVVVVGAHPDDETLGCGGSIARRVREGYEVAVVILTDGRNLLSVVLGIDADPSPAEVGSIRMDETRRATEILGVKKGNVTFLDFVDGKLAQQKAEATDALAAILRERAPAEVWSHNEFEHHPDHVAASQIARDACARLGTPVRQLHYIVSLKYGLSRGDIKREFMGIDVSGYLPLKKQALAQFRSHLGVLSAKQETPLVENFDNYLLAEEPFIVG